MTERRLKETIATYNAVASDYEQRTNHLAPTEELPRFTRLLAAGAKVLDAGCGYGRELRHFVDQGFITYGIDLSEGMLARARQRTPEASILKMDVRKLGFQEDFLDGVWCRGVLHHLERNQIQKTLIGIKRILKSDGILLVICQSGTGEAKVEEELTCGKPRFFTYFSGSELATLVADSGFALVEGYTYNEKERYGTGRANLNFIVFLTRKP